MVKVLTISFFFLFTVTSTLAETIDGVNIYQLQKMLKAEGFYNGPVNGKLTNATAIASRKFENHQNPSVSNGTKIQTKIKKRPLKRVGKRVSFFVRHKVDTDDCVQLYMFSKCLWVTYKFKFSGKIISVNKDKRTYLVRVSKKKLVQGGAVSMKYYQHKKEAINWLNNTGSQYTVSDNELL